ncbi:hypothetical protein IMCC3135_26170 [Granulosicoccus antarcticus IMCC3135]|uniref:Uncharacterized protein n=1 Tax=Granulosicoccus antarcticus IMCC3135 TaxID=1192854 RepID=A0A2Z2NVD7_9GAMM|nr:hypothetical protein IMCC3135_26170 [Granulosicoccus antarcticus IMCC3135]
MPNSNLLPDLNVLAIRIIAASGDQYFVADGFEEIESIAPGSGRGSGAAALLACLMLNWHKHSPAISVLLALELPQHRLHSAA